MSKHKWIVDGITSTLKCDFERIKPVHFNDNTKGYEYEAILAEYLGIYMNNVVDFHVRAAILDKSLVIYEHFTRKENEFDIVATFKTASPNIILKIRDIKYIPLEGIAFIIEVKQDLTKPNLEKDLKKYNKLNNIELERTEFPLSPLRGMPGDQYIVRRPIRILFYYENKIKTETLNKLLVKYSDSWDIVLVFNDDLLLGNTNIPIIKAFTQKKDTRTLRVTTQCMLTFFVLVQKSLEFKHLHDTSSLFLFMICSEMFNKMSEDEKERMLSLLGIRN